MDVETLRQECLSRDIDPTGKTRDELRELIKDYESLKAKAEESTEGLESLRLKLELKRLELDEKERQRAFEERENERQREEKERERDEKEKDRQHELKLRELDTASRQGRDNDGPTSVKGPRIPLYVEGDDIEIYLTTFERLAEANGWSRDKWAARLAAVLTGKAREAYIRMDLTDSKDFDKVRDAVLDRYDRNPEYYRRKFRESRKAPEESFKEWGIRTTGYFEKWVRDDRENAAKLEELFLMEQLLTNTTPELQTWLRQQQPKTVKQLTDLADTYRLSKQNTYRAPGVTFQKKRYFSQKDSEHEKQSEEDRTRKESQVGSSESVKTKSSGNRAQFVTCFNCGKKGHYKSDCTEGKKGETKEEPKGTSYWVTHRFPAGNTENIWLAKRDCPQIKEQECLVSEDTKSESKLKLTRSALVNDRPAKMVLDTASTCSLVNERFVSPEDYTGVEVKVKGAGTGPANYSLARIEVGLSPTGKSHEIIACVRSDSEAPDLILGYDDMERVFDVDIKAMFAPLLQSSDERVESQVSYPVETRASKISREKNEKAIQHEIDSLGTKTTQLGDRIETKRDSKDKSSKLSLSREELIEHQKSDESLAKTKVTENSQGDGSFFLKSGLIHRKCIGEDKEIDQLVVPKSCHQELLIMAHSIPMAGHLGVEKTRERLLAHFFWPGIYKDVQSFCESCPDCQKATGRMSNPPAKLQPIPPMGLPFRKIFMDIVGPLPRTQEGYRYILSVVDLDTRYPEAIPLKNQSAEAVADALVTIFSRVGIPQEISSDQGTNFMSQLVKELCQQLQIEQVSTTPYHQAANGLVERWNQTMKNMLKRMIHDEPDSWDRLLPYVLFAYREVPEVSTGFSPFELVYGWPVRGPLSVVKEAWVDKEDSGNLIDYVVQTRSRLMTSVEMAQENLLDSQAKMKAWYDQKVREQSFEVGEEVLLLLPTSNKSLEAKWQGPYRVVRKVSDLNYELDVGRARKKLCIYHVNLIKRWKKREEVVMYVDHLEDDPSFEQSTAEGLSTCIFSQSETWEDVKLSKNLSEQEVTKLQDLMNKYTHIFSDKPKTTNVTTHHIDVQGAEPIRQTPYRIPQAWKGEYETEIDRMIEEGIIIESSSEWASPVVLVPKKQDGKQTGIRVCIDFKKVNSLTKFDAYPLPRIEDLIENLGSANYISKLDLTKGYWQIPLSQESRDKTAFRTPHGLYEFTVLPFGLKTAGVTFTRMMDTVLKGTEGFAAAYLDDVVIYSITFEEHLKHLEIVFEKLSKANLVAKPSKCQVGDAKVPYLGHLVGAKTMKPLESKLEAIRLFPRPETKKEVRSFLGLTGYYNKYIRNYSTIAVPLTDAIKKKMPNNVVWTEECENAFQTLKFSLIKCPVLTLPNFDITFYIQVDASERGMGAVLCQKEKDEEHPLAYASRKLLPRETRLSTVEKECLALVWAVEYFRPYVFGRRFVIETDHNSLVWLNQVKDKNRKLFNWSLTLQAYDFAVVHRSGSRNTNADSLSRV